MHQVYKKAYNKTKKQYYNKYLQGGEGKFCDGKWNSIPEPIKKIYRTFENLVLSELLDCGESKYTFLGSGAYGITYACNYHAIKMFYGYKGSSVEIKNNIRLMRSTKMGEVKHLVVPEAVFYFKNDNKMYLESKNDIFDNKLEIFNLKIHDLIKDNITGVNLENVGIILMRQGEELFNLLADTQNTFVNNLFCQKDLIDPVINCLTQLIEGIMEMQKTGKEFHGDIKLENILVHNANLPLIVEYLLFDFGDPSTLTFSYLQVSEEEQNQIEKTNPVMNKLLANIRCMKNRDLYSICVVLSHFIYLRYKKEIQYEPNTIRQLLRSYIDQKIPVNKEFWKYTINKMFQHNTTPLMIHNHISNKNDFNDQSLNELSYQIYTQEYSGEIFRKMKTSQNPIISILEYLIFAINSRTAEINTDNIMYHKEDTIPYKFINSSLKEDKRHESLINISYVLLEIVCFCLNIRMNYNENFSYKTLLNYSRVYEPGTTPIIDALFNKTNTISSMNYILSKHI